jgi:hypothetical protein
LPINTIGNGNAVDCLKKFPGVGLVHVIAAIVYFDSHRISASIPVFSPWSRRRVPERLPKKGFALFEAKPSLQSPGSIEEYPMRGINSGHPACGGTSGGVPFLWFVSLSPKGHKVQQRNEQDHRYRNTLRHPLQRIESSFHDCRYDAKQIFC